MESSLSGVPAEDGAAPGTPERPPPNRVAERLVWVPDDAMTSIRRIKAGLIESQNRNVSFPAVAAEVFAADVVIPPEPPSYVPASAGNMNALHIGPETFTRMLAVQARCITAWNRNVSQGEAVAVAVAAYLGSQQV